MREALVIPRRSLGVLLSFLVMASFPVWMSTAEAQTRVEFETNFGRFVVAVSGAPELSRARENFVGLARRGDYDGTLIHRVVKDFLIQGGDPSGDGYGGTSLWGLPFEREIDPHSHFDRAGVLAMAHRADDQRNASQFFITLSPAPWLDGRYTILGQVVEGIEVVQEIGRLAVDGPTQRPIEEVRVKHLRILEAATPEATEN